ncbi:MAG: flagellar basal body protein [Defluviitaleaceae bacterium]|nr:flagellar basal body protein [Defluviitaleaceae bacterium]
MGFSGLTVANSGLRVAQRNLNVTGHNIANAETHGFSRQRIVQNTAFTRTVGVSGGGNRMVVGMGADWSEVHQIRNEFLDINFRNNVAQLNFYSTKVAAGIKIETLLGELHGGYNFQTALNNIWFSIQELTSHPEGLATRQFFLSNSESFLIKSQEVFQGLIEYQMNLDAQIREIVNGRTGINATVSAISDLNRRIIAAEAMGDNANDWRDERNLLLDHLATMIPIDVFYGPRGEVNITSLGHHILTGTTQSQMGLRFISRESSFVEPVFTHSTDILSAGTPPTEFTSYLNYLTPINAANRNDSGTLLALLQARGTSPMNHMSDQLRPPLVVDADQLIPPGIQNGEPVFGIRQLAQAVQAAFANPDLAVPATGTFGQRLEAAITATEERLASTTLVPPLTAAEREALEHSLDLLQRALEHHNHDPNRFIQRYIGTAVADLPPLLLEMERDYMAQRHNHRAHMWSVENAKISQVQINLDRIVNSVVTMINDALMGYLRGNDGNFLFYQTDANGDPVIPDINDIDPITGEPRRVPLRPLDMSDPQRGGIPLFVRYTEETHPRDHTGQYRFYVTNPDGSPFIPDPTDIDDLTGLPRRVPRRPWPISNYENPNSTSTIFTINNIRINPEFRAAGGHNLLALSLSGAPGDTDLLVALQQVWMSGAGHYSVTIGERSFNVQDAYIRFTGMIATETAEAASKVTTGTITTDQAQSMRMRIKGVSMDEEMASMLRFQFAFQAASRVFNMIDGMIDTIVNGTGRVGR